MIIKGYDVVPLARKTVKEVFGGVGIMSIGALLAGWSGSSIFGALMEAPNVQQRWPHVIIASAVTTALWIVATLLFRVYVQNFASYNKTYGTIGAVIMLLTWMYYSMFVVLVGGELASELHHGSGALAPQRGATYLGRIVSDSGPGSASMPKVKRSP